MSRKREVDAKARKVGAGLAVLVAGVVGLGWVRSRAARSTSGACKHVEDSVYRGFKYRIGQCPGEMYRGVVPAQQVGSITVVADEGDVLASIDGARKHAQSRIDAKLGPLQAIFVGANR